MTSSSAFTGAPFNRVGWKRHWRTALTTEESRKIGPSIGFTSVTRPSLPIVARTLTVSVDLYWSPGRGSRGTTYEMRSPACKFAVSRSAAVERSAGEISTESCEVMATEGEPVIDLRGRTARTSLPFSAGGMTTLAGAGAICGAGLGAGAGLADGVELCARGSRETSGVELDAGAGGGASVSSLVVVAELAGGEVVESLRSSGFLDSGFGLDSLDSSFGDGAGFLEDATADDSAGVVVDFGVTSR